MTHLLLILFYVSIPIVFLYFFYTTLLAMLPVAHQKKASATSDEAFHYIFFIPCLNEERVIVNTVQSILQMPYKNLTVVVIDDDSEDETVARARTIDDKRVQIIERKLPNAQLGKGESLNYAYQQISKASLQFGWDPKKIIVGIIDGDGRMSPDLLKETSAAFTDPQVGAAQARVRMTNRKKILPFLQDMEFYTMVSAIQNSRVYVQSVGLGGNGQFSRLSAMQEFGDEPWTKCLLEDFEFGIRLTLNGWKISHLEYGVVYQQGLTSIKRFIRQRSRWVQGNMQCFNYVSKIRNAPISTGAKLDYAYFLCQPWINLFASLVMLLTWILIALTIYNQSFQSISSQNVGLYMVLTALLWFLLSFGPGIAWSMIHYQTIQKEEPLWKCIGAGLLLPAYNLLVLPSIFLAWIRLLRGKQGWIKTERVQDHVLNEKTKKAS